MERLTEWIPGEHKAIPRIDLRSNGYEKCAARLAEYEDTGLTPEQVQKLKERDTAKKPIKTTEETGIRYTDSYRCPNCGGNFTGTGIADFCYHCGQRLDFGGLDEI